MLTRIRESFLQQMGRMMAEPGDSAEFRLEKSILLGGSLTGIGASVLWALVYGLLGEVPAAVITLLGYSGLLTLNTIIYAGRRDYYLYRFSQLFAVLILPFLLVPALGGMLNSGTVVLWALFSPMGGASFYSPRKAVLWFAAYAALVIGAALIPIAWTYGGPRPTAEVLFLTVLNIVGFSSMPVVTLRYFVIQRDTALALLRLEQAKSESLLLNILPEEIAAILRNESRTIADQYSAASILFADVVNFTPLSATLSPTQALELLNEIFSHFDSLVERYDLEKIKTIGDGYMVAGGVPRPRPDHAQAVARMGLDMVAFIENLPVYRGTKLGMRIGIHSGPVVAGVIGQKKFLYDLWGDTVNTASRMESHGAPGRVQISQATYELIKDEFVCERRGVINVKGKGEMETWYLVGPKEPAPAPAIQPEATRPAIAAQPALQAHNK